MPVRPCLWVSCVRCSVSHACLCPCTPRGTYRSWKPPELGLTALMARVRLPCSRVVRGRESGCRRRSVCSWSCITGAASVSARVRVHETFRVEPVDRVCTVVRRDVRSRPPGSSDAAYRVPPMGMHCIALHCMAWHVVATGNTEDISGTPTCAMALGACSTDLLPSCRLLELCTSGAMTSRGRSCRGRWVRSRWSMT